MSQKYIRKAAGWVASRYWIQWFWSKLAHPKTWTITIICTYAILIYAWVPAVINPPNSLEGLVGLVTMYLIASLILIGCVTGIPSAIYGRFRIEKWSVLLVLSGVILYVIIIHTLHFTTEGNRLPQGGTIAALTPAFMMRLAHVIGRPVSEKHESLIDNHQVKEVYSEENNHL